MMVGNQPQICSHCTTGLPYQGESGARASPNPLRSKFSPETKRPVLGQWLALNIFLFEQKLQSPETEVAQLATAAECCQETGGISKKSVSQGF